MSGRRIPETDRHASDIELARAWAISERSLVGSTSVGSAIEAAHAFVCHERGEPCPDGCGVAPSWRRMRILDAAYLCRDVGEIGYKRAMRDPDIWTVVWPVVVLRMTDVAAESASP